MNLRAKTMSFAKVLTLVSAIMLAGFSVEVVAQEPEATTTVALSPKVGKKLQEIQALVEAKQYAPAASELQAMTAWPKLAPYEVAQIWNLTAYNHYLQEDYRGAISAYERVLAQEIPLALRQSSLKTVAQLYFTIENYPKALERVKQLISIIDQPSGDVLMLLGQAYFQSGRYQEALKPIRDGIDLYKSQGKTPKENWLLLLRVCYYELQDYRGMVGALTELLRYYPKDTYLQTLAGAYSELGDTKKQLVITQVLYEGGLMVGSQHAINLANLYLMHEIPYNAAEVLEKAMASNVVDASERNLRLLSQAWYQAREDEKSIPPLKRAANMSGDGELYLRLAQSQLNLDKWDDVIDSVTKAVSKGGLKKPQKARIMEGMAYLNKKQFRKAKTAFEQAKSLGGGKEADQWLMFVGNEIKREDSMKQVVPQGEKREQDELLKNIDSAAEGD